MTPAHSAGSRFLRRRKGMIIVMLVLVAIVFVPMFAYSPRCYERHEPTSVNGVLLAQDYRRGVIDHLDSYDVPYMSVGNIVLLRFWTVCRSRKLGRERLQQDG